MSKKYLSPAKINLFLHIINKREDGYHNLQTVFQLIDLYDELYFNIRSDGKIKRASGNENIKEKDDLIIKAAKLLQKYTNTNKGADIKINKKIPIGAGLGGGSSNCATTLVILNKLWQINLSKKELMKLGLSLGADVPVFINCKTAWAEGIGDKLVPIKTNSNYFLLIFSNKSISTKEIFSHQALTMTPQELKISNFYQNNLDLYNDCLTAAISIQSDIKEALDWLNNCENYIGEARLSGTGSCVFIEFKKRIEAEKSLKKIPSKWNGYVQKAIDKSPIYWDVAKR